MQYNCERSSVGEGVICFGEGKLENKAIRIELTAVPSALLWLPCDDEGVENKYNASLYVNLKLLTVHICAFTGIQSPTISLSSKSTMRIQINAAKSRTALQQEVTSLASCLFLPQKLLIREWRA